MIEVENNCVGCPQGCRVYCNQRYVPVHHCENCGEVLHEGDNHWDEHGKNEYCDDCYYDAIHYEGSLTIANAIEYGEGYTEKVELNNFLANFYSEDEIEEILWNDFAKLTEVQQKEALNEWVKEDEESWIEFWGLEENING